MVRVRDMNRVCIFFRLSNRKKCPRGGGASRGKCAGFPVSQLPMTSWVLKCRLRSGWDNEAEMSMSRVDPRVGSGRVGSGRVEIFFLLENLCASMDPNLSTLTHNVWFFCRIRPSPILFTALLWFWELKKFFYCFSKIKHISFCCLLCILFMRVMFTRLCIFEYKFNNIENSTLSVIMSWSGRVSILLVIGESGRVGSGHTKWTRGHLCN